MPDHLTTVDVAKLLYGDESQTWRIQRLYAEGDLPEPPRFGGRRVIASQDLPRIIDALRQRRWLPETTEAGR